MTIDFRLIMRPDLEHDFDHVLRPFIEVGLVQNIS